MYPFNRYRDFGFGSIRRMLTWFWGMELRDFAHLHIRKVVDKVKLPMVIIKKAKRLNRLLPRGSRFRGDMTI